MTQQPLFIAGFEGILLAEAELAVQRSRAATTPGPAGGAAMAAILIATASFEALVGTWAAIYGKDYGLDDNTMRRWRSISITEVVKEIASRRQPPVTVSDLLWYPRLCAIVKLRNYVAHYFPELRLPGTWPDELRGFVQYHTFPAAGGDEDDWTSRILVPEVAQKVVEYSRLAQDGLMELAWKPPAA